MVRLFVIAPLLLLAGCLTAVPPPPSPQLAGIGEVRLDLDEMEDVPESVQELIYREIDRTAYFRGIPFDTSGTTVVITGYLRLVTGGATGTLVVYVFDFEDRFGRRLLRVGGQVPSLGPAVDPWDAVDREVVNRIVDDLFEEFDDWLAANAVGV